MTDEAEVAEPVEEFEAEEPDDDQVVIGVRFREAARMYHYAAPRGQVFTGDYVVVDRARGEQLARVVTAPGEEESPPRIPRDVRPIERLADADDRDRASAQAQRADEILHDMRRTVARDGSGLYPVAVELNLAGDRGTAWFQSEDHVDFRPMLEEIEDLHDVKLRMHQANQRERASLVDGYDICGLRLCCSSWMTDFPQVGIRVAKDQGLPLNPDAISGVCGRLLCCLTFEHEVYREMRGTLPRVGRRVSTPAGMGKVVKQNILQQKVTIQLDDHRQRVDVPLDEIGMAVRTEDAPNQALVEAERPQRGEDEQGERQRGRRRKRSRKPKDDGRSEQPREQQGEQPRQQLSEQQVEQEGQRPRRQRRRKPKVVNQDGGETAERPAEDRPRRNRRSRRSRRPVSRTDGPSEGGE